HKAYEYTQENIDLLLHRRHFSALERHSGIRTKGPKAFTDADRKKFSQFLLHIIENS
ncbi:MAG: DUF188 domain-containing protein, partial [Ruoffia tabacinasalis]